MKKKILWIEDDFYVIQGLFTPIKAMGFTVDVAQNAVEGYKMCQNWRQYDAIVVDLILPLKDNHDIPNKEVLEWDKERHLGIGLLKWLRFTQKVTCSIIILSVVDNPIQVYGLGNLEIKGALNKRGLLPSIVKLNIMSIIEKEGECEKNTD